MPLCVVTGGAGALGADVARTLAAKRPPGAELPEAVLELAPVLRAAGLLEAR